MSDNATPRSVAQGMARLKELLFDSEVETLGELDQRLKSIESVNAEQAREQVETLRRIEQLFDRAGTEERFRSSVATVLDKALNEAEQRNHAELSRAMAPLVIKTIKTELRNSQDELVDIMSPITGRMVKAYVVAEMKRLSDSMNRQIDRNPVMLRIRSLTSGKSVSDLAITYSQRLQVDEVFLIRRGSGELLARWPDDANAMSNKDIHMAGVLSAINEFASTAFDDDGGNIESFRLSGFEVFLRGSPAYLLAAKCNGVAPSGIESIFNDEFMATLERVAALEHGSANGKPVEAATRSKELLPLAQSVEARTTEIYDDIDRTSIGGAVMKALLFVIAVPLLFWFFWGLYTSAEESLARRSALHVINNVKSLRGYQTNLDVGYRGKAITVSGLVPDRATLNELTTGLGRELPGAKINARMAVIPTARVVELAPPPPQPMFDPKPLERRFEQRVLNTEANLIAAATRRAAGRADARLRQSVPEIDRLEKLISGASQRPEIGAVRVALQKAVADVAALRLKINEVGTDRAGLDDLIDRINQISDDVSNTIRKLAGIHGGDTGLPVIAKPAATTVVDAADDLASRSERLATLLIALNQTAAMIPEPAPPRTIVAPVVVTPQDRLRAFIAVNAVFFSSGTDFVSTAAANETLDEAAALIKAASNLVRVVGYTDEKGAADRNSTLAQSRADKVVEELVRRGVPADRVVGVGRSGGYHLSPGAGASSPNRRVQFEMGFRGEARGPQ